MVINAMKKRSRDRGQRIIQGGETAGRQKLSVSSLEKDNIFKET